MANQLKVNSLHEEFVKNYPVNILKGKFWPGRKKKYLLARDFLTQDVFLVVTINLK